MAKTDPKQSTRLVILVLYTGVLIGANLLAFGHLPPTLGGKGLWFYTGIASLILGNLLTTPFYTTPKDALANVFLSGLALYAVNQWQTWGRGDKLAFVVVIAYFAAVALAAIGTMILKDAERGRVQQLGNTLRILCEEIGNQRLVFSAVILFSVFTFHRSSSKETLVIMLAWTITVALKPDATILKFWHRVSGIWKAQPPMNVIGSLVACQTPRLMLIRGNDKDSVKFGTPLLVKDPHEFAKCGLALDYVGRDEGLLLRAMDLILTEDISKLVSTVLRSAPDSSVVRMSNSEMSLVSPELVEVINSEKHLVGLVAPDTSIERLYFEIVNQSDLAEGRLVGVNIGNTEVLYQIIGGLTKEDIVDRKNTFGYARGEARKIGTWDGEKGIFRRISWLPLPNAPVRLKAKEEAKPDLAAVGHFPQTSFNVGIESINSLVTYNTAILGILGIGKTMLALELVERMLAAGVKVICLDLTNQYASQLADYYNEAKESPKIAALQAIGQAGKAVVRKNVEEGGSVRTFTAKLKEDLAEFFQAGYGSHLKILNPSQFEVWRQDSKPYNDTASMASLTPTEITQIVSDVALQIVQEMGLTDKARLCLVYEEAHSLVPEWNSVAAEGDKAATNGTARAILQGRKYGMGCLLITQRTANVTKTILNQCNTIFAMRTFDETGKDFLSNYIGSEYAAVLPSLEERHAVFFGKASTCENPVLIRLNDQDKFRIPFRAIHQPPLFPEVETVEPTEGEAQTFVAQGEPEALVDDLDDDDIPF
ncbi:MAG: ATP-binding protein [Pyrinomonadaceae bacterium]